MPRVRLIHDVEIQVGCQFFILQTTSYCPYYFAGISITPSGESIAFLVNNSGTLVKVPSDAIQFELSL